MSDWRVTHHEWPFGSRVYTYGVAYARYLSAQFSDRASIWKIIDWQAETWPFVFNRGAKRLLDRSHVEAIDEARSELVVEQLQALAAIRERHSATQHWTSCPGSRSPSWGATWSC